MKRIICLFCTCLIAAALSAQDNLLLHYDFSSVSGTTVADLSPSGLNATLKGAAKVKSMGQFNVLELNNNNGYLDLGAAAGELFASLNTYTISMYYRVDESASLSGNGFFLWNWSTSVNCNATAGTYSAYRLNNQVMANATAGYNSSTAISLNTAAPKGLWYHIAYQQSGKTGRLYINGELVGTNTNMHTNSTLFGTTPPQYCFIGRPPFNGDNYLKNTLVYDIRLYGKGVGESDIKQMATLTEDLDQAFRYGDTGDFSKLKTAVDAAKTFLGTIDGSTYPASAIAEYEDIVYMCDAICTEGRTTQDIINNYQTMLTDAKKKLEQARGFQFDTSALYDAYDINRGFRHPGGLHTAKDFQRIRQQIAKGNRTVLAAYDVLKNSFFAQPTTGTDPTEVVVRGGGVGENYINCARAATTAYQNGLRWQIEGNRACAQNAVNVLMAWARKMKYLGGDSNYALAAGIYGYEFAQAAELVRDFDGWSTADFNLFRHWMIDVWYGSASGFLRGRNGTWENAMGQGGERPGHYWSNWGLCNALCVISIGILCNDVFIYNQGMSFLKYDQTNTFNWNKENTAGPIYNTLCSEFWGGLIPVVHADDRGPYGFLGQMQESGRDQGHASMALGLAVDCAQTAWNQGDDLYSYMNNRLAAGIEWEAAWSMSWSDAAQANEIDLPWTEYVYNAAGSAWHNAWHQTAAAGGAHIRNYWGRVIGHYEGVKGHSLPNAKKCLQQMGIDGGGGGATSGGYDHLGYSVLTGTYDRMAQANEVPTLLSPHVEYTLNGRTYSLNQSEVGGLNNTYRNHATDAIPAGTVIHLMPQISDTEGTGAVPGEGSWRWDTGQTTQDITITADRSQVYRVTYTNAHGVESEQIFSIAVADDCENIEIMPSIIIDDIEYRTNTMDVFYGKKVTLVANARSYYGYYRWDNGQTSTTIELPAVTRSRDISVTFVNAGGRMSIQTYHLHVMTLVPNAIAGGTEFENKKELVVEAGTDIVLKPTPSGTISAGTYQWFDAEGQSLADTRQLSISNIQATTTYTVEYALDGNVVDRLTYTILVRESKDRLLEPGNYRVMHRASGLFLANNGEKAVLKQAESADDLSTVWFIDRRSSIARYNFISLADSLHIKADGSMVASIFYPLRITFAEGTDIGAIYYNASKIYWTVTDDLTLDATTATELTEMPFLFIPVDSTDTGINAADSQGNPAGPASVYDMSGRYRGQWEAVRHQLPRGIYIIAYGNNKTEKIIIQ